MKQELLEGERLKTDLIKKLDGMVLNVQLITEKSPIIVEEYKEKITTRIHELLEETQIDEARIAQEVTMFADKVCVDEELVRLDSHIKAMKEALINGGTIGRRLDFIAQEMNRRS
ncbi:MAG: endoribonuclease YicC domain-containing protein [Eubacterium ventriosum]